VNYYAHLRWFGEFDGVALAVTGVITFAALMVALQSIEKKKSQSKD
jgi:hypothetical protein